MTDATARPRLVVLGLDGLPYSTACRLCRAGHLPNLARIALTPLARPIQAELPELSPVNWTSFFTAAGPEEHGIFGFTRLDPRSYSVHVADFTQVRGRTLFDRLGDHGLTSRVVNLPNTYPARPLKGMLVAGFVAQDLARATFPPFLAHQLRSAGYTLETDTTQGGANLGYLLNMLDHTLHGRGAALNLLWPDLAWDLFVFVLTETDRLGHFLFPALEQADHPWHGPSMNFLRRWDDLVGDILERYDRLPEPKRLLVLADHGFTSLDMEMDLNAWLREQGLFYVDTAPRNELDGQAISAKSRAFALDPGRIYLHTPRFARGTIPPGEAAELARRIKAELLRLQWQGRPVIREVLSWQEAYPKGAALPHPMNRIPADPAMPDLLCIPHRGFSLRAKFDQPTTFSKADRLGCHTPDDAFFYDSQPPQATPGPVRVRDVGRAVLEHFNAQDPLITLR
ncbi:alkaline phosphatase family protein [Desulfonatronum thioautotrophicum]|uniref:alkaline phosphatase family protein n=1 Tax=Desulfonatronum thioautotrophicum TaxID=617001 RepID=UPI0005EAF61C|nr:alkaline phosphatase family protein [Desulfonatronum thioautotrophicum]